MSLNERIKQARIRAGLTQEQLGKKIGVAKTTVSGYEKKREPDSATLGALMDALKVDANFLFQDEMKELNTDDFTVPEIKHIKKYRDLDLSGKELVDYVLNHEYKRCNLPNETNEEPTIHRIRPVSKSYEPIAAHNDNLSEEQQELMKRDLEEL